MHIAQGIIFALLFHPFLNFFEFYVVFFFPIVIDFDFLFSRLAKNENHRRLITHSLLPYVVLSAFGFIYPLFFILSLCGIVHLFIDVIDWGTALLAPFYKDPIGGILPHVPTNLLSESNFKQRQCWFTTTYFNSWVIRIIEVFFLVLTIIVILILNAQYIWLMGFYVLFLAFHLSYYIRCRRK